MEFVNLNYLRSGRQFVRHNENNLPYQGKYTRLEKFYNRGLQNMNIKTPMAPTQKHPPMSLDTKNIIDGLNSIEYSADDIRDYMNIMADCDTCKQRFYKRRAEKKKLKK